MLWEQTFTELPAEVAAGIILDNQVRAITREDGGTYTATVVSTAEPFIYGSYSKKRGWQPAPGMEQRPIPPQVNVSEPPTCDMCGSSVRHREVYFFGAALENHLYGPQMHKVRSLGRLPWLGKTCFPGGPSHFGSLLKRTDPFYPIMLEKLKFGSAEKWPIVRIVAESMHQIHTDGRYISTTNASIYPSTSHSVKARLMAGDAVPEVEGFYLPATMLLGWLADQPADTKMVKAMKILADDSGGEVSLRRLGLLVWLPAMQRQNLPQFENVWVGEVGQKMVRRLQVCDVKQAKNSVIVTAQDGETGGKVVWFVDDPSVRAGDEGMFAFNVRRHDTYRATKSTVVNRVKKV